MNLDPGKGAPQLTSTADADAQAAQFEKSVSRQSATIAQPLGEGTRALYLRVREVVAPVFADRALSDDIRRLRAVTVETRTKP